MMENTLNKVKLALTPKAEHSSTFTPKSYYYILYHRLGKTDTGHGKKINFRKNKIPFQITAQVGRKNLLRYKRTT